MKLLSFFTKPKPVKTQDVDELEELFSETLLWDMINTSANMMLIYKRGKGWIGANKKFYNEFGYKDIKDFNKQHDNIRELFLSESEYIFVDNDFVWLEYIRERKQDGHQVRIYNTQKEILDINVRCNIAKHAKSVYILEFENITHLENAKAQIKEVEALKTKFLANIGHEFRTPMNGILGFLELLSTTKLNSRQEEYLELIENSSKSLMSNIETLLDLSQMQGGRLHLENEEFELIKHMEELIYQHVIVAKEKGIKVLSFLDPKLPRIINGDIRKIKQIINALLQNAIKFTPRSGRVIVEIKLLKRQANGDCSIGFGVKDNGKGISSTELSKILEPFSTYENSDKRLGVGLSLCNGLVKLFGSEMQIKSEVGEGSNFNFTLNFRLTRGQSYKMVAKKKVKVLLLDNTKVDEANFLSSYLRSFSIDVIKSNIIDEKIYNDIETLYVVANQYDSSWMLQLGSISKKAPIVLLIEEGEKLQTKLTHIVDKTIVCPLFTSKVAKHLSSFYGTIPLGKTKQNIEIQDDLYILVVEDNSINQRLMQIMLNEFDIKVHIAASGDEAIRMAQKEAYDMIFMDIDLPGKNGIIATQEIKMSESMNSKTPVVALTAMAMQGDREMLLSKGLDDYLAKPITKEKLEGILEKYLKLTV